MAQLFPYTYISCPCSDESRRLVPKRASWTNGEEVEADVEETFDPRNPRSNFSLFPPEHLLYCEECHDIKCPRCVTEEIICWYCPSCLFEVPSSMAKNDDNRCSRPCFSCPVCTSQLVTASIGESTAGPFVLNCNYCMWSSLDIGLQFPSPTFIRWDIDKHGVGGVRKQSPRVVSAEAGNAKAKKGMDYLLNMKKPHALQNEEPKEEEKKEVDNNSPSRLEPNSQFAALKAFYRDQIHLTNGGSTSSMLDNFSSPSSLSRLMNLYSTTGSKSLRTAKPHATSMREARNPAEGFVLQDEVDSQPQPPTEYIDAATPDQKVFQYPVSSGNPEAKTVSQLWPMSTKLRTKRSKRCAECKHILVKPEFKVTSTRYRIKLVALNYIPLVTLKPLPVPGGLKPAGPDGTDIVLEPGKASQWIMKLTNPLFENVNVSLGSPSVTPGKHGHKVTILCPQFSIGKNGDVWDDALNSGLTKTVTNAEGAGEQVAGKVYESGRNWASVVVEIVPSSILKDENGELDEDEDVVEIPMRVRLEWTVADDDPERIRKKSEKALEDEANVDDGKRELAYWMVVGVGRVAV